MTSLSRAASHTDLASRALSSSTTDLSSLSSARPRSEQCSSCDCDLIILAINYQCFPLTDLHCGGPCPTLISLMDSTESQIILTLNNSTVTVLTTKTPISLHTWRTDRGFTSLTDIHSLMERFSQLEMFQSQFHILSVIYKRTMKVIFRQPVCRPVSAAEGRALFQPPDPAPKTLEQRYLNDRCV